MDRYILKWTKTDQTGPKQTKSVKTTDQKLAKNIPEDEQKMEIKFTKN